MKKLKYAIIIGILLISSALYVSADGESSRDSNAGRETDSAIIEQSADELTTTDEPVECCKTTFERTKVHMN